MANVGNFGDISFFCISVNGKNRILSFHDLTRSSTANYSEHERNGEKPYLERGGDGLDEISLIIEADANLGIKPLEVQNKLFDKKSQGKAETFVIGGRQIGSNPFVITAISEVFKVLNADGRPVKISFQLTLKEYANRVSSITTIPASRQIGAGSGQVAVRTNCTTYTVVKGDCLWNIAKKFYGRGAQYVKIYNANKDKIKNPNLIYPGQVLTIPL